MPKLKDHYTLPELEKAWKEFKPLLATNTGVSQALRNVANFDMNQLTGMRAVEQWMDTFNHSMAALQAAMKNDKVKKEPDAVKFLEKAEAAIVLQLKPLAQAKAGNKVYNAAEGKWVLSEAIKKQAPRQ
jgi:L-lactate utilization protein LutC